MKEVCGTGGWPKGLLSTQNETEPMQQPGAELSSDNTAGLVSLRSRMI